jgi:hypothetical protein
VAALRKEQSDGLSAKADRGALQQIAERLQKAWDYLTRLQETFPQTDSAAVMRWPAFRGRCVSCNANVTYRADENEGLRGSKSGSKSGSTPWVPSTVTAEPQPEKRRSPNVAGFPVPPAGIPGQTQPPRGAATTVSFGGQWRDLSQNNQGRESSQPARPPPAIPANPHPPAPAARVPMRRT